MPWRLSQPKPQPAIQDYKVTMSVLNTLTDDYRVSLVVTCYDIDGNVVREERTSNRSLLNEDGTPVTDKNGDPLVDAQHMKDHKVFLYRCAKHFGLIPDAPGTIT